MAKRAAVLFLLLAAADIAFLGDNKWQVLVGLFVGAVIGMGRFGSHEWVLKKVFQLNGDKAVTGSVLVFTVSQTVLFLLIVIMYLLNLWTLYGFVAGILIVPLIIMINSITEALGITKNNFE